eukprot:TRINITY_DN12657_c1_g1_i1.p1 TRINITY_DN12657_c1_g1~~TRINITY_DN12657_c1_g1_i1.p1  ORF type:complete len:539 (-),score=90.14 TRINITY_DN12657_c1_g1_i1:330-1946(-)
MVNLATSTALSSSFILENTQSFIESAPSKDMYDRKAAWGVFCVYMAIGCVGDFFVTFLAAPTLCQYVFGPMGNGPEDHTTLGQCNVAPTVFQISWNFKMLFGFFLDLVPFFGSRRKGWILFGWTGGLAMVAFNALYVESFVQNHQFGTYVLSLTVMCFFYCFSDVAADGMVVEMSKLEPEEKKGHLLTTCQMLRSTMMMVSTVLGTLAMSGESYQPPGIPTPGTLVLPFELPLGAVHWMLFVMAVPMYVGMWVWIRDPPVPEDHHHSFREGARAQAGMLWKAMKSFAVFMLIIQCYGTQSVASLMNPANNGIASISKPTSIQNGLGAIAGNASVVVGIWIFRRYFMATSWRVSLFLSQFLLAVAGALSLMSIYDTWGISRNGWFYTMSSNLPGLIQGIGAIVCSFAVVEISPKGLEATVYELLISANNGAMSMNSALQTLFSTPFELDDVNSENWDAHPEMVPTYQRRLMLATVFSLTVNVAGACIFMWFLPKNAEQCRDWAGKVSWQRNRVAILNCVIFLTPFIYANSVTVSRIMGN